MVYTTGGIIIWVEVAIRNFLYWFSGWVVVWRIRGFLQGVFWVVKLGLFVYKHSCRADVKSLGLGWFGQGKQRFWEDIIRFFGWTNLI